MEEPFKLALLAYFLYRLAKLDYLRRIAGTLGFICGAIVEARNLELTITARAMTEWALGGCILTVVLFQREIKNCFDSRSANISSAGPTHHST